MDILAINDIFQTALMGFVVIVGVFFIMRYLSKKEAPSLSKDFEELKAEITKLRNKEMHGESQSQKYIEELKYRLDEIKHSQLSVSDNERKNLVNILTERIRKESGDTILTEIKDSVKKSSEEIEKNQLIEKQYISTIQRLKEELFSLTKRGNLNLSIGIMTTVTGLALLGMFVLSVETTAKNFSEFFIGFLPRISLVLLIEVFAYFFLSLYKTSLNEIKYFQNEITSIECKYLALKVAMQRDDLDNVKHVIEQLSKTERNFILEKGQTTVDLERSKSEQQSTNDMLGKVADIFGRKS